MGNEWLTIVNVAGLFFIGVVAFSIAFVGFLFGAATVLGKLWKRVKGWRGANEVV